MTFRSFEQARNWARSLNLSGQKEWIKFMQTENRRLDVPTNPSKFYGQTKEWTNWYDWLGNG